MCGFRCKCSTACSCRSTVGVPRFFIMSANKVSPWGAREKTWLSIGKAFWILRIASGVRVPWSRIRVPSGRIGIPNAGHWYTLRICHRRFCRAVTSVAANAWAQLFRRCRSVIDRRTSGTISYVQLVNACHHDISLYQTVAKVTFHWHSCFVCPLLSNDPRRSNRRRLNSFASMSSEGLEWAESRYFLDRLQLPSISGF
jgi:hypothetical protein